MTNSLIVKPNTDVQEDMKSSSVSYTPYIVLLNSRSGKVSGEGADPGMIPWINKICLVVDGEYALLGDSFDFCFFASRMRATEYKSKAFSSVFNGTETGSNPDKYTDFRDRAKAYEQGYKFGPEFLIWIPQMEQFATLFLGDNQGRAKAGKPIMDLAGQEHYGVTVFTDKFDGPKVEYPRTILKAKRCDDPQLFEIEPDQEEAADAIKRFLNPPAFDFDEDSNDR